MTIAEDMIEGVVCSLCGQFFDNPDGEGIFEHGYPVYCKGCWTPDCGHQKAEVDTL